MKVKPTAYTISIDILCAIILAGTFFYLYLFWGKIPDTVPAHYNIGGVADRWGDKNSLLLTPVLAFVCFLGITVVEQFPKIWNTGIKITEENKEKVYRLLRHMLSTEKLLAVAVLNSISIIASLSLPLPIWFLPVFLLVTLGIIAFYLIKLFRAR